MKPARPYGLTAAQRDLLLIVQELTALDATPPTYEELARELSTSSKGVVHALLAGLRARDHIDWIPYAARSLTVLVPIAMPDFDTPAPIELTDAGKRALRDARAAVPR